MGELRRRAITGLAMAYRRWARRRQIEDVDQIVERAWAVVKRKRYCLVVTDGAVGSAAGLSARVVEPYPPRGDVIRFGTDPASRKVTEIEQSGRCLLVYQDDLRRACVTLECTAVVEPTSQRPWFRSFWRAFWPQGPTEEFVNISCRVTALEVWDGLAVIAPEPFGRRSIRLERDGDRWRRS